MNMPGHGCGSGQSAHERLVHDTTRRLVGLGWLANAIGAAGVFMAIGFLAAVFFGPSESDQLGRENLPVLLVSLVVAGVALTVLMKRRRRVALAWLVEGRDPTEREHRMTLGMPTYTAVLTASAWIIGGLVGGLINLDHGFETAALITTALWLGGDTTAALGYLLT